MAMTLILITILVGTVLLDYFLFSFLVRSMLKKGGMTALAQQYPATHQPQGSPQRLYFAMIGEQQFRRSVAVIPADEGLYLAIVGMFQWLARPRPALIPWDQIRITGERQLGTLDGVVLTFGEPPAGSLSLLATEFEAIKPYMREMEAPGL